MCPDHPTDPDSAAQVAAWADSGAMWLTGRRDEDPLGPPDGLVPRLAAAAEVLRARSAALGTAMHVDPLGLLAERAAITGAGRNGTTSCGGATRLVRTADGWLALSLARDDDRDLLPAWLGAPVEDPDPWRIVTEAARTRPTTALVDHGALLGLPIAALPTAPVTPRLAPAPLAPLPLKARTIGEPCAPRRIADALVVDLGSLWAGPLCGSLLAAAGARVVKVESTRRPDGARSGPPEFFDLMNAGKRSVALDLRSEEDRRRLARLISHADVVIEGSRPRALAQLGIDREHLVAAGGPQVWASITAHGRDGDAAMRVGFGDDAAVAGGLVSVDASGPCFTADAVADPCTGLTAAAAILDALSHGGRWLLDLSLSDVAAHLAGPTLSNAGAPPAVPPRRRAPRGTAPRLGEHTAQVLAEAGIP